MSTQLQGLQPHSRAVNRLIQLGQEYSKLPDSSPNIEFGYASAMSRAIRSEGFTVSSLIEAVGQGFVIRSSLMGYLEMADARSHHSPLHEQSGCWYCEAGGANPQPCSEDDPTGAIGRIEMIAEMLPSERREFLKSTPGPCPDADKVRDGWGGWLDPMTGQPCPKPGRRL